MIVNLGTNNTTSPAPAITSAVPDVLNALGPDTRFLILSPFNQAYHAEIVAATAQVTDRRVSVVDTTG